MISSLTGLRFFLAAMVVVYHYTCFRPVVEPSWPLRIFGSGFAAVSGFFVLSGFVLARNYITAEGGIRGSLRDFWVARFARIYPVYLLSILLLLEIYWQSPHGATEKIIAIVATLIGIQAWIPHAAIAFASAAWSLSVEGFLYVCFPLLVPLARGPTTRRLLFTGAACSVASLLPPAALLHVRLPSADLLSLVRYNPLCHVPAFLAGIVAERLSHRIVVPAWLVWPALASILCALLSGNWIPYEFLNNGLLIVPYSVLILGLATGEGVLCRFLSTRALVRGGEASYSLYLLHLPLRAWVLELNDGLLHLAANSWLLVGIGFVLCLMASLVSYRFVEEPYRRSIRSALASVKTKREWSFRPAS